jgi:hypothetical protein
MLWKGSVTAWRCRFWEATGVPLRAWLSSGYSGVRELAYDLRMRMWPVRTSLAALLLAAALSAVSGAPAPLAVAPLPSPAAAGSGQPQLSTSDRGVILSWIEKSGPRATLKFAERAASGWTAPRTVASGEDWFVNWADVPSVVRLADGTLAAHWLQKSGSGTYAYDVRLSYSEDGGRTWAASFTPHHDGTPTEHGFASLLPLPGAGLGLVWLDGRATSGESHGASAGHGAADGTRGAMALRFATFDRAWKQTSEVVVDPRVCECCPTAAAVTADGPVAAFRNRGEEEIRDIHVSRLENGAWTEPAAVHADGWTIAACPVNGPALSAHGRDVAIAWFTVKDEQGRAFAAFSRDAGRTFGAPIRLDDGGSLGRVDIELLPDGTAVATWVEFADGRAQFRARIVERSGTRSAAMAIAGLEGSRASGYPRAAIHRDEAVFAWTQSAEGRLQVRTARARLPQRSTDSYLVRH